MSEDKAAPAFQGGDIRLRIMETLRRLQEARATGDEIMYGNEVMGFKDLLPPRQRAEVEAPVEALRSRKPELDGLINSPDATEEERARASEELEQLRRDAWEWTSVETKYRTYCGTQVGLYEPILNEDGTAYSPYEEEDTHHDYAKLQRLVYQKFIELGYVFDKRPNDNRRPGYRSL